MSSFTSKLYIVETDVIGVWKLTRGFKYYCGNNPKTDFVVNCPRGMTTNFASSPKWAHSIIPPWGQYGKAVVMHDRLYETGDFSKFVSDALMRDGMIVLNVTPWKREVMYYSVKFGGHKAWNACRAKD